MPLLPEYLEEINDDDVIFRFASERCVYKQPRIPVPIDGCGVAAEGTPDVAPIQIGKRPK